MNQALEHLAGELDLASPRHVRLRLLFGHACVMRVSHLLEAADARDCLATLAAYLDGQSSEEELDCARTAAAHLANAHPGSKSLDGCGHAAVSASYAVAKALEGKALEAADYAAYAAVYAQGGAAAVADREAFEPEFAWQAKCLATLAA
jgi:hypothetical protein